MLITAIGVKLSSKGPILFSQIRIGKNNQPFTMYKFRSMRVNDTETTGWSHEGDPRKTRFGAFIRKFALDELPQFFNVLKGDMSLVGPRPEVPFYVEKFKKEVPLYMLKHTLRPGITGLAQIKGLRGDTSIQARINEDINYIENWTLLGDIRIDHYFALNMDGIALVNDAVGGVTVTITDDFSGVDSSLQKGEVTLLGEQALTFVQTRKNVGTQLNISRMERHRGYMDGLLQAITAKMEKSGTFIAELYGKCADYIVTNCSVNVISGLMERCSDYQLVEIVSPKGENVLGKEYYEFYLDEAALSELVLRLFYAPK
jgi:hypothetical protein